MDKTIILDWFYLQDEETQLDLWAESGAVDEDQLATYLEERNKIKLKLHNWGTDER